MQLIKKTSHILTLVISAEIVFSSIEKTIHNEILQVNLAYSVAFPKNQTV